MSSKNLSSVVGIAVRIFAVVFSIIVTLSCVFISPLSALVGLPMIVVNVLVLINIVKADKKQRSLNEKMLDRHRNPYISYNAGYSFCPGCGKRIDYSGASCPECSYVLPKKDELHS